MVQNKAAFLFLIAILYFTSLKSQVTEIKGFANVDVRYTESESRLSYFLGEQDLFISSRVTDRITFLGESVFKFSTNSPTSFNVSIERLIISYSLGGNHSILLGKHHTPFSYWNDKYHHGRVFFPTVDRPLLFSKGLIEIHTTGIALQGLNLGDQKIGYQLMVGNGIGSNDFIDDNNYKSISSELHAKPIKDMKLGITGYFDKFRNDAKIHKYKVNSTDTLQHVDITQLAGGAFFTVNRSNFEILTEAHLVTNNNDSVGLTKNSSFYTYFGYRISEKVVPYVRADIITIDARELFNKSNISQMLSAGIRYEFSYLAVAKMEYNLSEFSNGKKLNAINLQIAIGF